MDNHSIYIGNIQPCLNDRGGNQHINIPVYKGIHHILQFPLTHLAMSKIHPCIRHQLRNTQGNICNIRHSIINIINLSASAQFPVDSLSDCLFIIFHNICLDRHSVHRRLLQDTHIPDSDQAHMKSTGNGRCSQCKDIHILL